MAAGSSFFKRTELANKLATQVLNDSPTSSSRSGVFLAAPRRTGKSTFMREDFREALRAQGALVLYADLWEDKSEDPAEVISAAVREELAKNQGAALRLAKAIGLDSVSVAGVKLDLSKVGAPEGISLPTALAALSDEAKRKIVLIVDEAQHAITTKQGENTLFALKAARDKLNSSEHYGLRIVATGSNRDKLAMLTTSKDQAFFSAPLIEFPNLGRAFVDWFCQHSGLDGLDPSAVMPLFAKSGFRPEIIAGAVDAILFDLNPSTATVMERFTAAVLLQTAKAEAEKVPVIKSLTPIQNAVLRVMAQMGAQFAPFEARTLGFYEAAMAENGTTDVKADATTVQQALSALQEKGLVWKARRGVYDLEDGSIIQHLPKVTAVTAALMPAARGS